METPSNWLPFFAAALMLNLSPGPDLIYILSRTVAYGRTDGVMSTLGVCTGALAHVVGASLGLTAILATSPITFQIVKYIGAAYLVYLGIQALLSAGTRFEVSMLKSTTNGIWAAYRQGVLIDIFNPKVAIFFMAFLPQFVKPKLGMPSVQIFTLGMFVILVAIVVEIAFVFVAVRATTFFRMNRRASVWLDRVLGCIFIGLGIRLSL